jgi:hypothetical protein
MRTRTLACALLLFVCRAFHENVPLAALENAADSPEAFEMNVEHEDERYLSSVPGPPWVRGRHLLSVFETSMDESEIEASIVQAIHYFKDVCEADGNDIGSRIKLALLLMSNSQFEGRGSALEVVEQAEKLDPFNHRIRQLHSYCLEAILNPEWGSEVKLIAMSNVTDFFGGSMEMEEGHAHQVGPMPGGARRHLHLHMAISHVLAWSSPSLTTRILSFSRRTASGTCRRATTASSRTRRSTRTCP